MPVAGVLPTTPLRISEAGVLKVAEQLKAWKLEKVVELPGIDIGGGSRTASGESFYDWGNRQFESGRGVLLRGDPFSTADDAELYIYATRYYDLAFEGPRYPYVLSRPSGGWSHSALPHPDDPTRGLYREARVASGLRFLNNAEIAFVGGGVFLLGAVIWASTKG